MLYEINEKIIRLEREGREIIKFNLGDPDQQTPVEIIEAAFEAMKKGKTKYASAAGEARLREALAEIHGVNADNIVITPGSKWAVFAAMYLLLNKGDNVVIPSPHWTAYDLVAKSLGVNVKLIKTRFESNWEVDVEDLKGLINGRTRLIILNNPNNPTSKVMNEKVVEKIVNVANERGIKVLSDEVYADISFVKTKSLIEYEGEHIVVRSFSKTFAMTGWRIGYAITDKALADKIIKLNQITFTNVPVFIQEAALKALELRHQIVKAMRECYQKRADLANKILSDTKLKFTKPEAPFYVFPKSNGLNSEMFALRLLDKGVAVVPGTSFGDYIEHFRISLTAPDNEIELGLKVIAEAFK
ncbi:MAG: pyridoxal phosphate-dependent aminotransferase [Candidatus Bathyarchaeota archaeon]|nr:pyridoxal phosphate-dependent aminotransferase [Candidatus Bathyarchaeota archaeon]MDW8023468.1 pyridoxal phosphate-dependent aminotransferase [Nitrososphaerota archaeon]